MGKIEVVGKDEEELMKRMYKNKWKKIGVGRWRYGMMIGEDGLIRDEGVVGRMKKESLKVKKKKGGEERVIKMMEEYIKNEWKKLKVEIK